MFPIETQTKFWSLVEKIPFDECWYYLGPGDRYGKFQYNGLKISAHKFSYQLVYGIVKNNRKMHIDHICNIPRCVNPKHLRFVTARENLLKDKGSSAENSKKTHCKYGHILTYYEISGKRRCRECDARRQDRIRRLKNIPEIKKSKYKYAGY